MTSRLLSLLFFFAFTALPSFASAPPSLSAKVAALKGTVLFNGKELHEGDSLTANGDLETQSRSYVRLQLEKWKSSIALGPDTKMKLDLSAVKEAKRYQLTDGLCRWISTRKSSEWKGSQVFTKSASLGVRGTDFEIQHREGSQETEIIVFDGDVLFQSNLAKSEALIHKGQWGGVGGKFGEKVAKPIDLSPEQLQKARERSEEFFSRDKSGEATK